MNRVTGVASVGLVLTVIGLGGCSSTQPESGFTCADLTRIVRDAGHEPGRCYVHEGFVGEPPVTVTGR